jgi:plasmid replication initiation protein
MEYLTLANIDPEKTSKALIVKHNDLIEARYQDFSVVEQRIILMLLAQIQKDDKDFKEYRITVSDFSKVTGLALNGSFYENLRNTLDKLVSKTLHIRRNHGGFLVTTWLSSGEYIDGEGCIELCFDPKLKPYLLDLQEKYTKYKLEIAVKFKSQFSIRLYEVLKKQAQIEKDCNHRKNFEKTFSYEDLRVIFAVGEKEYLIFNNFKQKTIEPAIREVSDKTDLHITETRYLKTGRKITAVCFCVTIRGETETQLRQDNLRIDDIKPEGKEEDHPLIKTLMENNFTWEGAGKFFNEHGVKKIEIAIACMETERKNGKTIVNPPAYLTKAIAKSWGIPVSKESEREEQARKKLEADKREQEETERKTQERLARQRRILDCFYALSDGVQTMAKSSYLLTIQDDKYTSGKWNTAEREGRNPIDEPTVKLPFIEFLAKNNICS